MSGVARGESQMLTFSQLVELVIPPRDTLAQSLVVMPGGLEQTIVSWGGGMSSRVTSSRA